MTISSALIGKSVRPTDQPNPIGVGLMEYHQIDRAREAGGQPVACHKSWSWCTAEHRQGAKMIRPHGGLASFRATDESSPHAAAD